MRAMLDFTSARYLGLRHPRARLPDWDDLTTGMPAALGEPRATLAAARRLALAIGVERATLKASTLHAF
jgi:8-amino-7-oxononanoate synthase